MIHGERNTMSTDPDCDVSAEYVPLEIGVVTSNIKIEDPSASMFASFGANQDEVDRQLRRRAKRASAHTAKPDKTR